MVRDHQGAPCCYDGKRSQRLKKTGIWQIDRLAFGDKYFTSFPTNIAGPSDVRTQPDIDKTIRQPDSDVVTIRQCEADVTVTHYQPDICGCFRLFIQYKIMTHTENNMLRAIANLMRSLGKIKRFVLSVPTYGKTTYTNVSGGPSPQASRRRGRAAIPNRCARDSTRGLRSENSSKIY